MKNSSDTIGNRTPDLMVCGAVPQPSVPKRAPQEVVGEQMLGNRFFYVIQHYFGMHMKGSK